jgi:hypothetical protein
MSARKALGPYTHLALGHGRQRIGVDSPSDLGSGDHTANRFQQSRLLAAFPLTKAVRFQLHPAAPWPLARFPPNHDTRWIRRCSPWPRRSDEWMCVMEQPMAPPPGGSLSKTFLRSFSILSVRGRVSRTQRTWNSRLLSAFVGATSGHFCTGGTIMRVNRASQKMKASADVADPYIRKAILALVETAK